MGIGMAFEWSNNLSTGIDWQDRQHKELFKRINSLIEAMSVGLGKEEVLKIFKFLDDYFIVHFEAEEQAMNKYHYPGTLSHLAEHTRFIEEAAKLKKECEEGITTALVLKTKRQLVDWLIYHIGAVDKTFGAFITKTDNK